MDFLLHLSLSSKQSSPVTTESKMDCQLSQPATDTKTEVKTTSDLVSCKNMLIFKTTLLLIYPSVTVIFR
jgi:hypothetical protein